MLLPFKALVEKFALIIQSGKPVVLDGRATIRVAVFEPPRDRIQTTIPMFMGAGWGNRDSFATFSIEMSLFRGDQRVSCRSRTQDKSVYASGPCSSAWLTSTRTRDKHLSSTSSRISCELRNQTW
jgi:hypothetical protein